MPETLLASTSLESSFNGLVQGSIGPQCHFCDHVVIHNRADRNRSDRQSRHSRIATGGWVRQDAPSSRDGRAAEKAPMRAPATEKLTIPELIACYRSRELSPVEVIDRCLARVETLNPQLNAVVTVTADTARAAAREAEGRWRSGEDLPPLLGIPFTVKDTLPTAGVRTTF